MTNIRLSKGYSFAGTEVPGRRENASEVHGMVHGPDGKTVPGLAGWYRTPDLFIAAEAAARRLAEDSIITGVDFKAARQLIQDQRERQERRNALQWSPLQDVSEHTGAPGEQGHIIEDTDMAVTYVAVPYRDRFAMHVGAHEYRGTLSQLRDRVAALGDYEGLLLDSLQHEAELNGWTVYVESYEADGRIISAAGCNDNLQRGAINGDVWHNERGQPFVVNLRFIPDTAYPECAHCGNGLDAANIDLASLTCLHCSAPIALNVPAWGVENAAITRINRGGGTALFININGDDYTLPDCPESLETILSFVTE